MKKLKFILFILLVLAAFHCDNITGKSGNELTSIEGKIIFRVWEYHREFNKVCEPEIPFSFNTEKFYPYVGSEIVMNLYKVWPYILINFYGV